MKVLVTGGAGYVGWSVVQQLASYQEVDEVVIYDNFYRQNYGLLLGTKPASGTRVDVVVDDILNSRALKVAMQGVDCVCHLAAIAPSSTADDNPHRFDQVNHWGTAEVCYAVEQVAVPKLVYLSSGAIYGHPKDRVSVNEPPLPVNAYGRSKLAGEKQVKRLASRHSVSIIRSGTVYGVNPAARFDTFVNRFLLDAALGRSLNVNGSGAQLRPIISVDILAAAIVKNVTTTPESPLMHAVEENIAVNDVVRVLKKTEPHTNVIYINQQHQLPDLQLTPMVAARSNADPWQARLASDLLNLRLPRPSAKGEDKPAPINSKD